MAAARKPRKSGGSALADALINRNVKEANEERDGEKHIGGMKKGGRAHKATGGNMSAMALPQAFTPVARKDGGKCGGGPVSRASGGRTARKHGGRAKKGMNVNIIIAPASPHPSPGLAGGAPPMPPGGPVGLRQGVPPPPPMMPPGGAPPPMGPPPMARKSGGRAYPIENGAGGGKGRLEKIRAYGWGVNTRVMVGSDFSAYRQMIGTVISLRVGSRLVLLDALPNHPMIFEIRELIWLWMLTANNQFETELKKRIAEEIDRLKDNLAAGLAVTDYAKYQHLIGQIAALHMVVDSYCDEVTKKINER